MRWIWRLVLDTRGGFPHQGSSVGSQLYRYILQAKQETLSPLLDVMEAWEL